jgi:hypothetical protein
MIQRFSKCFDVVPSRKGITVLLVFWLNLVLLPCAMALDTPDQAHDCCPFTIEMQQAECCDSGAVTLDKRDGKFEDSDEMLVATTDSAWVSLQSVGSSWQAKTPPDLSNHSPPLHKLFCVYLE